MVHWQTLEQDFGWNNEYMNFINGTAGKRNKIM